MGAFLEFRKSRTTLNPHGSTSQVVSSGIYTYTRNPIYLGFLLMVIGLPLTSGLYWGAIVAPFYMMTMTRLVIEREEAYRKVAADRIERTRKFDASGLEVTGSKRAEPRVPFGQVVERGMLRPGEELFSIGNRFKAKVRADGTLIGNDIKGPIHQLGAAYEGAPSCNGWTYWHFKRDGKMIPIDILRQQIRAEMEADQRQQH